MKESPKAPMFPIYQLMEGWAAHAFGTPGVRAQHHALYYALLNLVKTKGGMSRFELAYQHGMEVSGIGSKATYLAALRALQEWKFITYTEGENAYVRPIIEVHFLASTGPLLDLYRTSTATATLTSTGRNKELRSLNLEVGSEKKALTPAEKKLQTELWEAEKKIAERDARIAELKLLLAQEGETINDLTDQVDALTAQVRELGGTTDVDTFEPGHNDGVVTVLPFQPDPSLPEDEFGQYRAIPKSIEMVDAYLARINHKFAGYGYDFFNFYDSRGWKVGIHQTRCENWKSLLATWKFKDVQALLTEKGGQLGQRASMVEDILRNTEFNADGSFK